ncbi:uncharacterized protein EV154DRAFT_530420 [Mucor mucedo]|uniref:Nitrogen regulatory protein areA GATA-like domain-containing protein n=1 Tax=Mucor saturninus TaxID=64648 RepID=A0A8H7VCB0_9FUNG|nr:uncharacterized protein EV154DRAFT_530420 [Mucor mucedo]KAG2213547.1 hypothetical protein INT47_009221 [Mucor saturninus]KAI7869832.1 hypothetical protein EV154DRAFT_530420 [Mucor mucedo]
MSFTASSAIHEPSLSLSCSSLDSNELGSMWTVYKCKPYRTKRLEYMSWRQWHLQNKHKEVDNKSTLLLSAAATTHDAYSHEVPQTQKCYPSTIHHHASTSLSRSSSFCKTDALDEEDDDDYYLSDEDIYEDDDDEDLYQDDVNYHFVKDFTKTQPRPATPRRSLLSDLLQRAPSLLSNSSCSFTSNNSSTTQSSILLDDTHQKNTNHHTTEWRESFHGW